MRLFYITKKKTVEKSTQHIISYLENKLSSEERKAFEEMLGQSAELQQELKEIRFIRDKYEELQQYKQIDTKKYREKLFRKIAIDKYKRRLWRFTRDIAAVLILPLMITSVVLFKNLQEHDNMPVEQIEQTSANGLISKIMLPDGSEVWLNSGSKLTYPQRFTGDFRRVDLSGEAYFKVKANKRNRFEVFTKEGLKVSAYGTEFNIRSYAEEQTIETTLVAGNVEIVSPTEEKVNLTKGQQAEFNKKMSSIKTADVNLAVKTSWKDGKIIFRRTSMKEVARRLSRRFNVDIQLKDKALYDYEYSASFITETLDEILYLLEKSAPITCEVRPPEPSGNYFTKRTVIISMKRE